MNQGIDSLIGHRLDAYGSNPQALMERYQLTGETVDLLALQAAANIFNEAKNNMLANAETEMPNEKQALEQEVVEGSRNQILSQLGPGIQQQGMQMEQAAMQQPQQVAMQQPPPPQQQMGLPTQPANNMMMAAQGGIVGYQGGGDVGRGINMEALLDALMFAESGGDPNAVGAAGEEGAFQIMQSTANDPGYGMSPMEGSGFDPEASRKFARHILQTMLDRYDGDIEAALIAYNAGATNADRFIAAGRDYSVLPQPTTQRHVRRILGHMQAQRGEESIRGRGVSSANLDAAERRRTLRDNPAIGSLREAGRKQDQLAAAERKRRRTLPANLASRNVNPKGDRTRWTNENSRTRDAQLSGGAGLEASRQRNMENAQPPGGVQLSSTSTDATQYNREVQNALNTRLEEGVPWRGRRGPEGQTGIASSPDEASQIMRYLAMMQGSQNMINAADPAATLKGIDTNREFEAPRREPRENNSLAYLQNIGKQQQGRRDAFGAAFPEAEGAIARAQQERADGGIGYLRRLARKQEGKRQEGSRAARYLAMMQQNQNMVDAVDPAGRARGQEQDVTPPVDILKYLAMLQQNQNMVSALEEEEEAENLQSLIGGRRFNSGGGVRGLARGIFDPREWDWLGDWVGIGDYVGDGSDLSDTGRRRVERAHRKQELKEVEVAEEQLLEEQLLEAGIDPGIAEGGWSPILRRMGEGMPDWVGSEGRRRLQEEQRARDLKEQFPGLESDRIRAIIATEVVKGELNQPGRIEDGKFVPTPSVPPTPVTVPEPEPEPEVVIEEEVVEDTRIKPDWNMLREWGAGGMGATTTADALGGSGRAVGVEIARQERAALEGRILTAKEAQMQIDREVALAINNRQLNVDAQERLMEYRENTAFYYAAIAEQASQQTGNIYTAEDVGESMSGKSPDAAITAAVRAVDTQFLRQMGVVSGLGAPKVDVVAQAMKLNEGS
jgi:hypothetical protein